jgi:hypothetical protein
MQDISLRAPHTSLSLRSRVVRSQDQVSCDLAGEIIILELGAGVYYGLNKTGSRIWELLESPVPASSLQDALLRDFDVEPERCERDLLALLEDLASAGLVHVCDEVC